MNNISGLLVLTILKNDGIRQWVPDDIPYIYIYICNIYVYIYMKWKIKHVANISNPDNHQPDINLSRMAAVDTSTGRSRASTPLKNDGVSNSWDDDIPNMMEQ